MREIEIRQLFARVGDCEGSVIAELGVCGGVLTYRLAEAAGANGRIYALDNASSCLEALQLESTDAEIVPVLVENNKVPLADASVDLFVSLGSFHHVKSKRGAFREIYRILLKPCGKVISGDVRAQTPTQRYFDEVVITILADAI